MTRLFYTLTVTVLLAGQTLAEDVVPTGAVPPEGSPIWMIAGAAAAALAVLVVALKLRKPTESLTPPKEEKDDTPIQPRKQIENPITLKQQKPDSD